AIALRVTATDESGFSADSNFTLLVHSTNSAPFVASASGDQVVPEDQQLVFTVPPGTFVDPDAGDGLAYGASLANGDPLPAWLTFEASTQTLSGTPDDPEIGTIALRVTATDTGGLSAATQFNLTVTNVNEAPVVANALADRTVTEYVPFALSIAGVFSDIDAGDRLTYSAASPSWLRFNATTGTFSGTPTASQLGTYNVAVTATDRAGLSVADNFTVTVAPTSDMT